MTWTIDTLHREIGKARKDAKLWVELTHVFGVSPGDRVELDDATVISLNYYTTRYGYKPRRKCPKWIEKWCLGRTYDIDNEKADKRNDEYNRDFCYGPLIAEILKRRGFTGYVQDSLPF